MSSSLDILVSYAHCSHVDLRVAAQLGDRCRLVVDSGAFTAWSKGWTITLDDYCAWLRDLPFAPEFCIQLDVIGDPGATVANYRAMRERGLRPVPVVTPGSSTAQILELAGDSERLCIGGVARAASPQVLRACAQVQQAGVDLRRCHLLGRSGLTELRVARPGSCDASTPTMSRKYGRMLLYDGCRLRTVTRTMYGQRPPSAAERRVLWSAGIEVPRLAEERSWRGGLSYAMVASDVSWLRYCADILTRYGVRVYDAIVQTQFIRSLDQASQLIAEHADRWLALRAARPEKAYA